MERERERGREREIKGKYRENRERELRGHILHKKLTLFAYVRTLGIFVQFFALSLSVIIVMRFELFSCQRHN